MIILYKYGVHKIVHIKYNVLDKSLRIHKSLSAPKGMQVRVLKGTLVRVPVSRSRQRGEKKE